MKTTDLRINNHVQLIFPDGEITVIVEGIKWDSIALNIDGRIGWYDSKDIEPTTLTEQWLLDFGFEETIEESFIKELYGATLIIFIINGVAELIYKHYSSHSENEIVTVNAVCLLSVGYVHQLQNLYFALFQEELILKGRSKE